MAYQRPWRPYPAAPVSPELHALAEGYPLIAQYFTRRGLRTAQDVRAYLDPDQYSPSPPSALPGMALAVERLQRAVLSGERICVWGDFDVDGQTATTSSSQPCASSVPRSATISQSGTSNPTVFACPSCRKRLNSGPRPAPDLRHRHRRQRSHPGGRCPRDPDHHHRSSQLAGGAAPCLCHRVAPLAGRPGPSVLPPCPV